MSSKINVLSSIRSHLKSALKDADGALSYWDLSLFIFIPLLCGAWSYFSPVAANKDAISLIVTAASIFAGLLLNLLVLVYDQTRRVDERLADLNSLMPQPIAAANLTELMAAPEVKLDKRVIKYEKHKGVLAQLLANISFAIIVSLLVILCSTVAYLFAEEVITIAAKGESYRLAVDKLFFSCSVFLSVNLILTILMIVKRVILLIDDR